MSFRLTAKGRFILGEIIREERQRNPAGLKRIEEVLGPLNEEEWLMGRNLPRLGDRVKDVVTGARGILVAKTEYLFGCVRAQVQPEEVKDGKVAEVLCFDYDQIETVEVSVHEGIQPKSRPSTGAFCEPPATRAETVR